MNNHRPFQEGVVLQYQIPVYRFLSQGIPFLQVSFPVEPGPFTEERFVAACKPCRAPRAGLSSSGLGL